MLFYSFSIILASWNVVQLFYNENELTLTHDKRDKIILFENTKFGNLLTCIWRWLWKLWSAVTFPTETLQLCTVKHSKSIVMLLIYE